MELPKSHEREYGKKDENYMKIDIFYDVRTILGNRGICFPGDGKKKILIVTLNLSCYDLV